MKNRVTAALASSLFFCIAPATVAGWVPWWLTRWRVQPPLIDGIYGRWLGALLVVGATVVVIESFARFALTGIGSPAPVAPTRHLVVSGFYRHVRNPMYVGVTLAILGQAFWFGSVTLVRYAALVFACFFLFVLFYEEPTLRRQFGAEYESYCAQVPRWWPRITPWKG